MWNNKIPPCAQCLQEYRVMGTMESNSACGTSIFFSVFLMAFLITPPCNGGKILVFSLDGSHWINMKLMIEELHARGHSISVIRPSKSWYIEEVSPLYDSINIPQSKQFEDLSQGFLERYIRLQREGSSSHTFLKLTGQFL
ncbi:unnamed protein product [Gadus morhua 'NCC']